MKRLFLFILVGSLASCANCSDRADGIDADEADAEGTPFVNNTMPDGGVSDATVRDAQPDNNTDACRDAANGASCDSEGVTCNYTCDGVCGFCSGIQCSGGVWSSIEDFPPAFCDRGCDPVDAPCTDPAYPNCQWIDEADDSFCLAAGETRAGESCDPADARFENAQNCAGGTTCVADPDLGGICARTCTPGDTSAINCPYGCKPASDFGIDDPDLGFCVVPHGEVCVDNPPEVVGECDPFAQDCAEGFVCQVVIIAGPTLVFETACREFDPEQSKGEKEACDSAAAADCAPGLKCYEPDDTCLFLCRLSDGIGCTAGKSCSDLIENDFGLGYCTDSCR